MMYKQKFLFDCKVKFTYQNVLYREIILDYAGGFNIVTWTLKSTELFGWKQRKVEGRGIPNIKGFAVLLLTLRSRAQTERQGEKSPGDQSRSQLRASKETGTSVLQAQRTGFCLEPSWSWTWILYQRSKWKTWPASTLILALRDPE